MALGAQCTILMHENRLMVSHSPIIPDDRLRIRKSRGIDLHHRIARKTESTGLITARSGGLDRQFSPLFGAV